METIEITNEQTVAVLYGALTDPELRKEARRLWKEAAHRKELTAASCAAYHLILGGKLDKAFCPITNPMKLENACSPWEAKESALDDVKRLREWAFLPWKPMLEEFYKNNRSICLPESAKQHPLVAAAISQLR